MDFETTYRIEILSGSPDDDPVYTEGGAALSWIFSPDLVWQLVDAQLARLNAADPTRRYAARVYEKQPDKELSHL